MDHSAPLAPDALVRPEGGSVDADQTTIMWLADYADAVVDREPRAPAGDDALHKVL